MWKLLEEVQGVMDMRSWELLLLLKNPPDSLSPSLSAGLQQRRCLLFLVSVRTGYYLLCIVVCFVIVNI